MNRREFLTAIPLSSYSKIKYPFKPLPVNTKQITDNNIIFISRNNKLKIQTDYDDYGGCVVVSNYIDWEDPISKSILSKKQREMFILDLDTM